MLLEAAFWYGTKNPLFMLSEKASDFPLAATKHEVWCVPRSEKTVKEKWEAAHEELQQEPAVRMFAAKKRRAIESRFDHLVGKQGSKNSAASRASGCGNTSADVMTEDEAKLVRIELC